VVGCEDGKGAADTRALGIRWTRDTRPARGGGVLSPCRYVPVCPFQVEVVGSPFSRLGLWNRSWAEPDFSISC